MGRESTCIQEIALHQAEETYIRLSLNTISLGNGLRRTNPSLNAENRAPERGDAKKALISIPMLCDSDVTLQPFLLRGRNSFYFLIPTKSCFVFRGPWFGLTLRIHNPQKWDFLPRFRFRRRGKRSSLAKFSAIIISSQQSKIAKLQIPGGT